MRQNKKYSFNVKTITLNPATILSIFGISILFSFDAYHKPDAKNMVGIYGVCNGSETNSNSPKLILNEDSTFIYTEYNGNSIDVRGLWTTVNKTIRLKPSDPRKDFHHTWHVKSDNKCITSRKGMAFYRLCRTDKCH